MHVHSRNCNLNKERNLYGEYVLLFKKVKKCPIKFKLYMRMKLSTFKYILYRVEPYMRKNWCNLHKNKILPEEQLVVTLRYLATGQTFTQLSLSFRMGVSTVSKIIGNTMDIIWKVLSPIHMPIPSEKDFLKISQKFYSKWGMPNCIGSLDGRHVRLKKPYNSGSLYFNYKKFFSVSYQALVDADYKYISIDVGSYGSQSDAGVFANSHLKRAIDNKKLKLPRTRALPNSHIKTPFYIIGDGAYPLLPYLMKPFPGENLSYEQNIFNSKLSRARCVVENCFGYTCQKWRVFYTTVQCSPQTVNKIIKSTCILHNILIDLEGNISGIQSNNSDLINLNVNKGTGQNYEWKSGKEVRDQLIEYLVDKKKRFMYY